MMRRLVAGLLVLGLTAVVLALPTPALARHRGHFIGGFATGAVTGFIVGNVFAPRPVYVTPPVVYQPAPVYVTPPVYVAPTPVYVAPTPVCSDYWVNGYWSSAGWVQPHWERVCR